MSRETGRELDYQSQALLNSPREELVSFLQDRIQANPFIVMDRPQQEASIDQMMDTKETPELDKHEWFYDNQRRPFEHWNNPSKESLWEFITNQIMCYRDTPLRALMLALVDELDEDGYLKIDEAVMCERLQCSPVALLDAITLLQQLEPVGVAARSLRECWLLQTEQDPYAPPLAVTILTNHFDLLAARKLDELAERLNAGTDEIIDVLHYYQHLSAAPGDGFRRQHNRYIVPDVYLQRAGDGFVVQYNRQGLPFLQFNQHYYESLLGDADQTLRHYLETNRQDFEQLVAGIAQREQLVLLLTNELVMRQMPYLLAKGGPKQAVSVSEVAEACQLTPDTVRQALSGKYVYTDFGIIPLQELITVDR